MIVYGINPVLEALRAGRVTALRVGQRTGGRIQELQALAAEHGVKVQRVDSALLDRLARGGVHQGVVADVQEPSRHYSVEELVRGAGPALIVVLDGIEDPHNVGAILRTADAAGVDGVIVQNRRTAALGGAAAKASAGAVAHVKIAHVVNIARAIDELKGHWRLECRPRRRCGHDVRRDRFSPFHQRLWWVRRAVGCGGLFGRSAISPRAFRCAAMFPA
jgi:23S rRNA (guanosine2251-2'-O)-methyltransferase